MPSKISYRKKGFLKRKDTKNTHLRVEQKRVKVSIKYQGPALFSGTNTGKNQRC